MTHDRPVVWWVGPPPPASLSQYFLKFGLMVRECGPKAIPKDPAGLRMIFIAHSGEAPQVLRAKLKPLRWLMDCGVAIRLVVDDIQKSANDPSWAGLVDLANEVGKPPVISEPDLLLRECLEHHPGVDRDKKVVVVGEGIATDSVEEILIQRAFSGLGRVELKLQKGGKSGARIWRAVTHTVDGYPREPFIVKIDDKNVMVHEQEQYSINVRDQVGFPYRPGTKKDGLVLGRHKGLLASMFVEGAERYDDAIRAGRSVQAIEGLFAGPLRTWRKIGGKKPVWLGRAMVALCRAGENKALRVETGKPDSSILPPQQKLANAFALAEQRDANIWQPAKIWAALEKLPPITIQECMSHCDLNARNFFLRPPGEVVLIDFTHVGIAPASRDIARVEVATTWDVDCPGLSPRFLDNPTLEQLYLSPLIGGSHSDLNIADPRIAAVIALRERAKSEGIEADEYETMIACHLLRYARYALGEVNAAAAAGQGEVHRLRALAYQLAVGLVKTVAMRANVL